MIGIAGAGAFGTALAIAQANGGREVRLWGRSDERMSEIRATRRNSRHLPDALLPESVTVTADIGDLAGAEVVLLCVPMQSLGELLELLPSPLSGQPPLVACCKGVELRRLQGPVSLIRSVRRESPAAILTGPSFARDIALGLPTALTLAAAEAIGVRLQTFLSTPTLRLYRTDDTIGAELGGALKNVVAIGAGVVIGSGLGNSARAALVTRGYAEMVRLACRLGARAETLAGLSGFGDLVLTSTSDQSRNFRFGEALGQRAVFDPHITVEGVATAAAVMRLAASLRVDMPVTAMVDALARGAITLEDAIPSLMTRPLKQE